MPTGKWARSRGLLIHKLNSVCFYFPHMNKTVNPVHKISISQLSKLGFRKHPFPARLNKVLADASPYPLPEPLSVWAVVSGQTLNSSAESRWLCPGVVIALGTGYCAQPPGASAHRARRPGKAPPTSHALEHFVFKAVKLRCQHEVGQGQGKAGRHVCRLSSVGKGCPDVCDLTVPLLTLAFKELFPHVGDTERHTCRSKHTDHGGGRRARPAAPHGAYSLVWELTNKRGKVQNAVRPEHTQKRVLQSRSMLSPDAAPGGLSTQRVWPPSAHPGTVLMPSGCCHVHVLLH